MKAIAIIKLFSLFFFVLTIAVCNAQMIPETQYAVETETDSGKVVREHNLAILKFNSNNSTITFSADLARFTTGDSTADSMLAAQEQIPFVFIGNLGEDFFDVLKTESFENYRKIAGTITVNGTDYASEADVAIRAIGDKAELQKALFNLRLEVDPKKINIPVLSDYYHNKIDFIVVDNRVNKYGDN